jgi:hypothetical protein
MTDMGKPSAADRTVDMFTGSTNVEAAEQSDVQDEKREPCPPIEVSAERWRNQAMSVQEHVSKHFNDGEPGRAVFRLTNKDNMMFLEQFRHGKDGKAFHWSGVMFHKDDLYELTNVFVRASKAANGS